jgi:hypothetical protein
VNYLILWEIEGEHDCMTICAASEAEAVQKWFELCEFDQDFVAGCQCGQIPPRQVNTVRLRRYIARLKTEIVVEETC